MRRRLAWRRATSIHATAFSAALILLLGLLAAPLAVEAQEAGKLARIGYLGGSPSDPLVEAFKQGLRELGYVEGRNISIEYRWVEGRNERLAGLAADLVRLKVDVIVASGQGAVAARQATTAIPIVMPIITDPVRLGLVASLARPGGNATGFATQNDELPGKWMELVKATVPKVSRLAVLFHPTYDGGVQLKASEAAARSLGVRLQALNVERPDDLATTFAEAQTNRAEALIVSSSPLFYAHRRRILWTYHVNLAGRFISREAVLAAVETYQLVEAYPDDKYLPSYLVLARHGPEVFHALFAADVEGENVRVVKAYFPDSGEWQADFKARRPKR